MQFSPHLPAIGQANYDQHRSPEFHPKRALARPWSGRGRTRCGSCVNCVRVGHTLPNSMTLALATCEVTKERGLRTADFRAVRGHGASPWSGYRRLPRGRLHLNYFLAGWALPLAEKRVVG